MSGKLCTSNITGFTANRHIYTLDINAVTMQPSHYNTTLYTDNPLSVLKRKVNR